MRQIYDQIILPLLGLFGQHFIADTLFPEQIQLILDILNGNRKVDRSLLVCDHSAGSFHDGIHIAELLGHIIICDQ